VVVANEAMGIRRTLVTNEAGVFRAPALVPAAEYAVTVTKEGFALWEVQGIGILAGQDLNFNVTLNVAATARPIVEQTKTGVSQVVESGQILDLPINGRRVDSFVLLTPAVVPDGNENDSRTRISAQIWQDAVQEFQVLSVWAGHSSRTSCSTSSTPRRPATTSPWWAT
jgi:hypothetical protein